MGKNKRKLIVETKLNLYQNDVKRKVWRRRETVHDVKHMDREHRRSQWVWIAGVY